MASGAFLRIAPLFYAVLPIWLCVMWFKYHQAPNLTAIVANFTFLFGFIPGLHESIAWAGWSIGVEMIFYALLPLIFLAARAGARAWRSTSSRSWRRSRSSTRSGPRPPTPT
jgi:peptidoglycan/LPS O-acetylase OafA/YrhL